MPKKIDPAVIRVVVKFTKPEAQALQRYCDEEVRTVGSWFRLQVQRAWREYNALKREPSPPPYQRNSTDGVKRDVDVWARLTDTERDQLDILADAEGLSVTLWFRKRFEEDPGVQLALGNWAKRGRRKAA